MSDMSEKTTKVHCNQCGRTTKHEVRYVEDCSETDDSTEGFSVTAYEWNRMLLCAGCSAVSIERVRGHSEDWDADDGINLSREYFPPRTFRPTPVWLAEQSIPEYVSRLLAEIYVAVQNDARSLAAMGIRALLEALMVNTVGDRGSFAGNLAAFVEAGHVSTGQRGMFESVLEAGHATMHRGYVPDSDALVACLDATEHVVQSLYIFPIQSAALKKVVPSRKAGNKTNN